MKLFYSFICEIWLWLKLASHDYTVVFWLENKSSLISGPLCGPTGEICVRFCLTACSLWHRVENLYSVLVSANLRTKNVPRSGSRFPPILHPPQPLITICFPLCVLCAPIKSTPSHPGLSLVYHLSEADCCPHFPSKPLFIDVCFVMWFLCHSLDL